MVSVRFSRLLVLVFSLAVIVGIAAVYQRASAAPRPVPGGDWPQYRYQVESNATGAGRRLAAIDEQQSRVIVVGGEGTVYAEPDMANVSLGVQTSAPTAAEAQSANAARMSKVVEKVLSLGVDRKDIRTSSLNLYPTYDRRDGKSIPTGYQATHQVSITVRDLKNVAAVLDGAVAVGGNTLNGVSFGVQDDAAIRREALAKAAEAARPKADVMARAMGVQITGVQSIVEQGGSSPAPREAPSFAAAASDATPVLPGQLSFVASVRVTFTF